MEGKEEEKKERSHSILQASFLKIMFNLLRVLGEAKNNNSVLGLPWWSSEERLQCKLDIVYSANSLLWGYVSPIQEGDQVYGKVYGWLGIKQTGSRFQILGSPKGSTGYYVAEGKRSIPGVASWDPTWLMARKRKEKIYLHSLVRSQ